MTESELLIFLKAQIYAFEKELKTTNKPINANINHAIEGWKKYAYILSKSLKTKYKY